MHGATFRNPNSDKNPKRKPSVKYQKRDKAMPCPYIKFDFEVKLNVFFRIPNTWYLIHSKINELLR